MYFEEVPPTLAQLEGPVWQHSYFTDFLHSRNSVIQNAEDSRLVQARIFVSFTNENGLTSILNPPFG